ncbi:MAG: hypothetical protein A4E72_02333 [Syntrophus sp. PtaU1.Bin208]|nr:MAG: hypothetical protein A4E72_02333 [Syntrophus sp. PtaU1.Bin208]
MGLKAQNLKTMKKILFSFLLVLAGCSLQIQEDHPWTAFYNEDSTLIGFRDRGGRTRIEPRYSSFTTARKFEQIMAVMEQNHSEQEPCYLTKSGKIVGNGNVYIFDNAPDCESEGFIRFRDKGTAKVGMYNGRGEIVIPAEYDDLTNVRNGLVVALKGAVKEYWNGDKDSGCEHFSWKGGRESLLNTKNKIIVDDFKYDANLDFFSLKISAGPVQEADRDNFPGLDGRYYAFLNYRREFQGWLKSAILSSFSREKLIEGSYREIYFWKEPDGWTSEDGRIFIEKNYEQIKNALMELTREKADYFISIDGLNPFIYNAAEFEKYFDNCGKAKEWQYPVMSLVINRRIQGESHQDQFDFLRTERGYKLISVTLQNGIFH